MKPHRPAAVDHRTLEHRPITAVQQATLDFISTFAAHHHYPPSFRDIMCHFNLHSTNTVADRLTPLLRRGLLHRHPRQSRTLVVA